MWDFALFIIKSSLLDLLSSSFRILNISTWACGLQFSLCIWRLIKSQTESEWDNQRVFSVHNFFENIFNLNWPCDHKRNRTPFFKEYHNANCQSRALRILSRRSLRSSRLYLLISLIFLLPDLKMKKGVVWCLSSKRAKVIRQITFPYIKSSLIYPWPLTSKSKGVTYSYS